MVVTVPQGRTPSNNIQAERYHWQYTPVFNCGYFRIIPMPRTLSRLYKYLFLNFPGDLLFLSFSQDSEQLMSFMMGVLVIIGNIEQSAYQSKLLYHYSNTLESCGEK